jgi:electron transport complex protein RnfB
MAFAGIALLGALTIALGGGLGWARGRFRPAGGNLVDAIDLLLPQTQCERCGYPGCRPYADAVASGVAINRCPPGGTATIEALASLLGREATPLDPDLSPIDPDAVALIDESRCIGCALCLPACPVDAIVGAAGHMHTVIARQCTGCELCIPACPVDCISMCAGAGPSEASPFVRVGADAARAAAARRRFEHHTQRAEARARAAEQRRQQRQSPTVAKRNWDDA